MSKQYETFTGMLIKGVVLDCKNEQRKIKLNYSGALNTQHFSIQMVECVQILNGEKNGSHFVPNHSKISTKWGAFCYRYGPDHSKLNHLKSQLQIVQISNGI